MNRIGLGLILPNGPESPDKRATFLSEMERDLQRINGHFTSAWTADHLQAGDGDMLEGWTVIAYLAAAYPDLQFGHTVLCQSYRNPALLAKMVATLQFLSGGRFVFGIGAGWKEDEYRAYNFPFPAPGVRVAELEETVQICKALWTQTPATFEGRHYAIHEAYCEPKPDPVPPIMIAGWQPRILRVIARHADWWDVSGFGVGLDRYRLAAPELERACAEVGRDPATLRHTFSGPVACARTEEAAQAVARANFRPNTGFVGTAEQVVAQMRAFVELGVDHFQIAYIDAPGESALDLLIEEVLPALNT